MDYMIALATQMELDHLESEARRLEHRHGHDPYPRWDEISNDGDFCYSRHANLTPSIIGKMLKHEAKALNIMHPMCF
jgi:hypothetical protein